MIIPLPHTLDAWSMYGLISRLINENREPRHNDVMFDFSTLGFIKPVGVTILSNLIELLAKNGVEVKFLGHDIFTQATKYLDDSLFFEQYLSKRVFNMSGVRTTTLPLKLFKHQETYSWIEYKFIPWLSGRLNMNSRSFDRIKTCLQELFNNIKDHSHEETGSIFVQQYPNKNLINIALSDFGVGIPHNVRKVYNVEHDGQAIFFASREGVTTRSTPQNAGAGLDIFLNIVARNQGRAIIYSNFGVLSCTSKQRIWLSPIGWYPGTLFDINFRTDTIEPSDDDIEDELFEW